MIRRAIGMIALVAGTAVAQPTRAIVRDAGPGPVGRHLAETLARSDTRVLVGDTVVIADTARTDGSVVVIAKRVIASGTIRGDLIVVGGDLFLHPGVSISGQAIAIGGGVLPTFLGHVEGGSASYRDFTFDAERVGGVIELRYRETVDLQPENRISFTARIPSYDRSNGLSLSVGPEFAIVPNRLSVGVAGTYRSQLGKFDPSGTATWTAGRKFWVDGFAGKDTRTNEGWINSSIANSLSSLLNGRDDRNWYRTSVAEATAHRKFETPTMEATYQIGGRVERATAARPGPVPTSGPWSLLKRKSGEGMWRPNPQIPSGRIASAVGGARYMWTVDDVKANLDVDIEVPVSSTGSEHFVQTTVDGQVGFPTFGMQRYRFDVHAILTGGDAAPMQRWGYLGGSGTLPTVEPPLSMGGDELLYIESRYSVPMERVVLPFVGSPTFMFRHILGAAGVQSLPSLTQIVAFRLSVTLLRAELALDTKTRKTRVTVGLSLFR